MQRQVKRCRKATPITAPPHEIPSSPLSPASQSLYYKNASQSLYWENATSPLAFPHYCYFRTESLMKGWLTIKRLPVVSDLLTPTIKIYLEHSRRDSEWFFPSFPRAMFQPKAPPSSSSAKGPPSVLAGALFHCDNTYCIIRLCWSGFENQWRRKQL